VGFELTVSAGERPQTYALDRAATGTGAVGFSTENLRSVWLIQFIFEVYYEK